MTVWCVATVQCRSNSKVWKLTSSQIHRNKIIKRSFLTTFTCLHCRTLRDEVIFPVCWLPVAPHQAINMLFGTSESCWCVVCQTWPLLPMCFCRVYSVCAIKWLLTALMWSEICHHWFFSRTRQQIVLLLIYKKGDLIAWKPQQFCYFIGCKTRSW